MKEGKEKSIRPELLPGPLLAAYASGVFPMPDPEHPCKLLWFSPQRRGLLPLDERFHVPRRLGRTIRQGGLACTLDRAFDQVMRACAQRKEGTWISEDFLRAYGLLHKLGFAHSVEAWAVRPPPADAGLFARCRVFSQWQRPVRDQQRSDVTLETCWAQQGVRLGELAGGVYGVALGGAFFAESMFHRLTDAGKVALAHLVEHLRRRGFVLCDIQWLTKNLRQFGAIELPKREYLGLLKSALEVKASFVE